MVLFNSGVKYIVNSVFDSLTYILKTGQENDCFLVDCGDIDSIINHGWNVKGVLLTHSHFDHIYGLNKLIETFPNAIVYTNQEGKEGLINDKWNFSRYHTEVENFIFSRIENVKVLDEGIYELDENLKVKVIYTPGHDPSCISYIIENNLFTGDAYIPGIEPFHKFPRSNKEQAISSLALLKDLKRSHGYTICAGHPFDLVE